MSFDTTFYTAVEAWLESRHGEKVDSVTSADFSTYTSSCGYGTCQYDEKTFEVSFVDSTGKNRYREFEIDFGTLLSQL